MHSGCFIIDRLENDPSVCRICHGLEQFFPFIKFKGKFICLQTASFQHLVGSKRNVRRLCSVCVVKYDRIFRFSACRYCHCCFQLTYAVVCHSNLYVVYCFIVCYSAQCSPYLIYCVSVGSGFFIIDRIKYNASVCCICLCLQDFSLCIFQFKTELVCIQVSSFQILSCLKDYRSIVRCVCVVEYDRFSCFSACCYCHCRFQLAYTVVCHSNFYVVYCFIVCYSAKCSSYLIYGVSVGSGFFIIDRIKYNASVCCICLCLQDFSLCILQFKTEFVCVQSSSVEYLCCFKGYRNRCCFISVRKCTKIMHCYRIFAYFGNQSALSVIYNINRNFFDRLIVNDSAKIASYLFHRVSMTSSRCVVDSMENNSTVCRICHGLKQFFTFIKLKGKFICIQAASFQYFIRSEYDIRRFCRIAVFKFNRSILSSVYGYKRFQRTLTIICYFNGYHVYCFIVCYSAKCPAHFCNRIFVCSCLRVCECIKYNTSVCCICLCLEYRSLCIFQFKAELVRIQGSSV